MTVLQCIRCIDPFCSLGIWPFAMARFLQLSVTITIYFQYSATTYVVMDTLYACVLKRTPSWLAYVVSILPISEFFVGFAMYAAEYAISQQWIGAIVSFYVVLMFTVNLLTYNISGIFLIRILRKHQDGATAPTVDDTSGSKSASPFDVVIAKTIRSMILLSLPSVAALIMFLVVGVANCNTDPSVMFDPSAPKIAVVLTIFVQLILGLLFTRVTWISKTILDAEVVGKAVTGTSTQTGNSTQSSDERRTTRTSQAEKKVRTPQSQLSRPSKETQAHVEVEMQQLPASTESCASVVVAVDAVCENTDS
jgi:hypothetical protein